MRERERENVVTHVSDVHALKGRGPIYALLYTWYDAITLPPPVTRLSLRHKTSDDDGGCRENKTIRNGHFVLQQIVYLRYNGRWQLKGGDKHRHFSNDYWTFAKIKNVIESLEPKKQLQYCCIASTQSWWGIHHSMGGNQILIKGVVNHGHCDWAWLV